MKALAAALVLAFLSIAPPARAKGGDAVFVGAAADLRYAMPELIKAFDAGATPSVVAGYGSSGAFFAQITHGAPFDAFFSANATYAAKLVQARLAEGRVTYATGQLVLWAPQAAGLDFSRGLAALLGPGIQKVAIANPAHAPYGAAAVAALGHYGLYERVAPRLVVGENIAQAMQFVTTGSAQAGLLALSLVSAPVAPRGRWWVVPKEAYPPLVQDAVVVSKSARKARAEAFLAFVRGPRGQAVLKRYGFLPPPGGVRPPASPRASAHPG